MSAESGSASRNKLWWVVLVTIVVVFAIGWWAGRAGPQARVAELTVELAESRVAAAHAEQARVQAAAWVGLLQAQSQVMQAAIELDQRNFGIANRHVAEARQALAGVDVAVLGLDAGQVSALKAALDDTDLAVAADLAGQRQALVGLIERIQALLPRD